jgi:hypothetical protein
MTSVNVVMITDGKRPRLAQQTLDSLVYNTPGMALTVVCDGAVEDIPRLAKAQYLDVRHPMYILGLSKNLGALVSAKTFGKQDWLYFCDDDVYHRPGWFEQMVAAMDCLEPTVGILGGGRHPFHGVNSEVNMVGGCFQETDAVAGYSMLLRWGVWDLVGGFDQHAKGTGQSEDFALSRRVISAGMTVGYINPTVVVHCGLTRGNGERAGGWEQFEQLTDDETQGGVVQL